MSDADYKKQNDIKSQLLELINRIEDEETLLFITEIIKRLKD